MPAKDALTKPQHPFPPTLILLWHLLTHNRRTVSHIGAGAFGGCDLFDQPLIAKFFSRRDCIAGQLIGNLLGDAVLRWSLAGVFRLNAQENDAAQEKPSQPIVVRLD